MTRHKPIGAIPLTLFRRNILAASIAAMILVIVGILLWRIHAADEQRSSLVMKQFTSDARIMAESLRSLFSTSRNALALMESSRQIQSYFAAASAAIPESELSAARARIGEMLNQVQSTGENFLEDLAILDTAGNVILVKSMQPDRAPDTAGAERWPFSRCVWDEDSLKVMPGNQDFSSSCLVMSQPVDLGRKRVGRILVRLLLHSHLLNVIDEENSSGPREYALVYGGKIAFSKSGQAHALPPAFEQLGQTPATIPTPQYLLDLGQRWAGTSVAVKTKVLDTPFDLVALAPRDTLEVSHDFLLGLSVSSLGLLLLGSIALLWRVVTDRTLLAGHLEEQREAAALIQKHVDEFDMLFNALPGLAWRKDAEGRFVMVNPATCDFFGRPRESILGKRICDLLPAELAELFEQDEIPLMQGQRRTVERELEIDMAGQSRTINRRLVSLVDGQGRVEGIIGLTTDVTQHKYADKIILRTAKFQKVILELAINFVNRPISELDQGIVEALALVGKFCDIDRACFFRYDYSMETLSIVHEWHGPDSPPIKDRFQNYPSRLFPGLVETHRANRIMSIPCVEDLPPDDPMGQTLETSGTKSAISVPLYDDGTCFGFVGFASRRPKKAWTEDEVNLILVTAELLMNTWLRRKHEQRLIEARTLAEEAYDIMEKRIEERTQELADANRKLKEESAGKAQLIRDLETIQNSISAILIAVDDNGLVARWSIAAEKAFGITYSDTIGKVFQDLPLSWDWDIVRACIGKCVSTRNPSRASNVRFVDPAGRKSVLMLTASALNADRGHEGYLLLGEDVTEIITLEAQLSQAAKMEAIGQLAAGIAHEINTPTQYVSDSATFIREVYRDISTIIDAAEGLCAVGGPLPPEAMQKLCETLRDMDLEFIRRELPPTFRRIETGIEKISSIVKAMNKFAYYGNDEKRMTDINDLLDNALTISQNEWKYVANLTKNFDSSIGEIMCSPGDISQVFLNIVINAAHAIEERVMGNPDKGTITVSTHRSGPYAEIRISDTGAGIPEHLKDRIFNLFFTTKTIGKGTGQGLAIAYDTIVTKHGGEITFESRPGHGTTFIIRLPHAGRNLLKQ